MAWLCLAFAQEEPALATDQPQFETEAVPLYRVERTKTLLVPTQGRARAIILNPEAVEVDSVTDSAIVFRGLQIDSSVVHLFDDSGRRTIRIEVTELVSIVTEIQQRQQQAVRERLGVPQRSLKFRYRGTQRHLERGEKVSLSNTGERFRIRTHELTGRMDTPAGEFYSRMFLEQRRSADLGKEVMQPRHLSAELRRVDLGPLGPSDLVAGDKDLDLSNFTIDGRRYRGFGLFPAVSEDPFDAERPALDRKFKLAAFGGEERQGFGLDLPAGLQSRQARSRFSGAKMSYALWKTGHLYLTGLHRYGKGGELRSDHVAATGFNTAVGEKLWLKGEAARNGPEGAYELEAQALLTDWLKTRNRVWRVGKNYRTVTGTVSEEGQTGWKGWVGADLLFLDLPASMFAESTLFKDRNAINPVNPQEWNTIYTVGTSSQLPWQLAFQGSAAYEDESASPLPYVNRRYELNLSRPISFRDGWLRSLAPFAGYRHSKYEKSNNVPGFDAKLDVYRTGIRASLAEGFWAAVTWSEGRLEEENPQTLPAVVHPKELTLEAGKSHVFKVIPATLNLSVQYEDVQQTFRKTHQPFPDQDRFGTAGRFSWRLGKERELFAEVSLNRQKSETTADRPVVDLFAQFGVELLWDTGFTLRQKGGAAGEVFIDLNGNGRREPGEAGLDGVRVYVEGGPETVTRPDGHYRLKGIPEGPAVIRVDPAQIPKGYSFTTPNSQPKLILPRKEQEANFGISTEAEFRGVVFNDLNEDLIYQEGFDRPVQGVRMMLESGQASLSAADGFYSIRKASPGEHTLSVDVSSIPDGYRTLIPVQQGFQPREGEVVRQDLPLKAQRSVSGSVYVDADGNRGRRPGEKGVEGVRLRLDGQQAVTEADGAFRFTNVQPGRYSLRPDPSARLPSGYRFASSEPLRLEVPEGPFVRERFDLAVVPVDAAPSAAPVSAAPAPAARQPVFIPEGEFSAEEFEKKFPVVSIPEGTGKVYVLPAPRGANVFFYVHETLRPALEQRVFREAAGLPPGIRLELRPIPSSESSLRRPGLLVLDWMLERPLPGSDLSSVELALGQELPPLAGLVLQALKGDPGIHPPEKALGSAAVRDGQGNPYWVWFLE